MATTENNSSKRVRILETSISLFAKAGYEGVSMRDIATAVGVTVAALYYHFSDKERLYLDALDHAFRDKTEILKAAISGSLDPWTRLESFVVTFAHMLAKDKNLWRLLQWVQMDGDKDRLRKMGSNVFKDLFIAGQKLAGELGQGYDFHLLTVSIFGLIIYPYESGQARRYLPGYRSTSATPATLAKHVVALLRNGLSGAR